MRRFGKRWNSAVGEQVGERSPAPRSTTRSRGTGSGGTPPSRRPRPSRRGSASSRLSPPCAVTTAPASLSSAQNGSNTGSAGRHGRRTRVITGPGHEHEEAGVVVERPLQLGFTRLVGVDQGEHGRGEDALLVGEAPVLVQPAVERPERGEQRRRVVDAAPAPCRRRGWAGRSRRRMPCSSISCEAGVAVAVLGVLAHRVEVAEQLPDVLALRVAAAEVLVERARLGDRVERRVRDEAVDLPADQQPLSCRRSRPTAWCACACPARCGG